jgi:hypothetical protein
LPNSPSNPIVSGGSTHPGHSILAIFEIPVSHSACPLYIYHVGDSNLEEDSANHHALRHNSTQVLVITPQPLSTTLQPSILLKHQQNEQRRRAQLAKVSVTPVGDVQPATENVIILRHKANHHSQSSKKEFDDAKDIKDTLLVLDCFATWCGPCKVIAPQVVK